MRLASAFFILLRVRSIVDTVRHVVKPVISGAGTRVKELGVDKGGRLGTWCFL